MMNRKYIILSAALLAALPLAGLSAQQQKQKQAAVQQLQCRQQPHLYSYRSG